MGFSFFKKKELNDKELCPLCNKGYKVERYNSKNELVFFGCTNFPNCKYKEKIKDDAKYYVDILIEGYESPFTYRCSKDFNYKVDSILYKKEKYGSKEIKIVKERYIDKVRDNMYYLKLELVDKDYQPVPNKYIDVRFKSSNGEYFSRTTYTYICPEDYNLKEGDIITIISKYGESKVLINKAPYIDPEKDKSSFYKEITIIDEEQ